MEDANRCVRKRDRHIRLTRKNVERSFFLMRSHGCVSVSLTIQGFTEFDQTGGGRSEYR